MNQKKYSLLFYFVLTICFIFKMEFTEAASVVASANTTVITAIAITNTAPLNFGTKAAPGDAALTVLPADAGAAVFNITGQANQPFTIQIPAAPITMITGIGGANRTISVSTFTSTPSGSSTLSGTGTATLRVGATRAALPATQITGTYTATFTVSVIY